MLENIVEYMYKHKIEGKIEDAIRDVMMYGSGSVFIDWKE
jgi:hypothetical protein